MYVGIAPALACAVVTQIAFLVKQRGARARERGSARPSLQGAKALLRAPWFALGVGASGVAWVGHDGHGVALLERAAGDHKSGHTHEHRE